MCRWKTLDGYQTTIVSHENLQEILFCIILEICVQRILSNRQKPCLQMNNFTYLLNNRYSNKIYWVCSKSRSMKCHARVTTQEVDGREEILKVKDTHNHKPEPRQEPQ